MPIVSIFHRLEIALNRIKEFGLSFTYNYGSPADGVGTPIKPSLDGKLRELSEPVLPKLQPRGFRYSGRRPRQAGMWEKSIGCSTSYESQVTRVEQIDFFGATGIQCSRDS